MGPLKKRILSFKYAFQGIRWAFATQPNLWIHLLATVFVILTGIYFKITATEWCILALTISAVFTSEFFNTAIEWLVDSIYKERHPLAGKIKDVSAAAVLIIALAALVIGVLTFLPYITKCLK